MSYRLLFATHLVVLVLVGATSSKIAQGFVVQIGSG